MSLIEDIKIQEFFSALSNRSEVFFVGGCVRDIFLKRQSKDIDLLVIGLTLEEIASLLSDFGKIDLVGQSFGVIKFMPTNMRLDEPIDISIPRKEINTGSLHTDVTVITSPTFTLKDDMQRRDFTMNAIALNSKGEFIDLFNGINDISDKLIKCVNQKTFTDDPLRILRAIQFSGRLEFNIDNVTQKLIRKHINDLQLISSERFMIEIDKIIHKSTNLNKSFKLLNKFNLLDVIFNCKFKSIIKQVNTKQDFVVALVCDSLFNDIDQRINALSFPNEFKKLINTFKICVSDAPINMKLIALSSNPEAMNITKLNELTNTFNDRKLNNIPITLKDLPINGNDFKALGFTGKDIWIQQHKLLNFSVLQRNNLSKIEAINFLTNK